MGPNIRFENILYMCGYHKKKSMMAANVLTLYKFTSEQQHRQPLPALTY